MITDEDRAERKRVATTKPCDRCGTLRKVRPGRAPGICKDCRFVDPLWPYVDLRFEVSA